MAVTKVNDDVSDKVDNRYYVQLYNPAGGKYKKVVRGHKAANDHETEMKNTLRKGGLASATERTITVEAYLEKILESKATLAVSTVRKHRSIMKNHLVPALGARKVSSLARETLLLSGVLARVERDSGREARRHAEALLRSMLKVAVREGVLDRNPLDGVPWPKRIAVRGPVFVPEFDDLLVVREKVATKRFAVATGAAAMTVAMLDVLTGTGVRVGELMGISEDDVDFEAKTITVRRQVIYDPQPAGERALDEPARFLFSPPKTDDSGPRTIPVPQFVLTALATTKLRNGTRDVTLPWEHPDGKPQTHRLFFFSLGHDRHNQPCATVTLAKRLASLGRQLGLAGDLHPHCYRHRYTTALHDQGVPQIVIDYVTGHLPTGSITMRVYTKATKAGLDRARTVIDAEWREAQERYAASKDSGGTGPAAAAL